MNEKLEELHKRAVVMDTIWQELLRRAAAHYGERLQAPTGLRPVLVVDGFRFFVFKREKDGKTHFWFGDGPMTTGTTVADFPYDKFLAGLDGLVEAEKSARTISETK